MSEPEWLAPRDYALSFCAGWDRARRRIQADGRSHEEPLVANTRVPALDPSRHRPCAVRDRLPLL